MGMHCPWEDKVLEVFEASPHEDTVSESLQHTNEDFSSYGLRKKLIINHSSLVEED